MSPSGGCGEPDRPRTRSAENPTFSLDHAWQQGEQAALRERIHHHHNDTAHQLKELEEATKASARKREELARKAQEEAERAALEARFPNHGVVYHYLGQVFAGPRRGKPIGYLRRGSQFRAGPPLRGPGCAKSWHRVPGDGFVCHGNGFQIGDTPQTFEASPNPPELTAALPYQYGYAVVEDRPQYWRLPTTVEEEEAATAIALMREAEEAAIAAALERESALAAAAEAGAPSSDVQEDDEGDVPTLSEAVQAPPPPGESQQPDASEEHNDGTEKSETEESTSPLPGFVRSAMRKGFYVSIDGRASTELGRQFYRTVRGGYVRASDLRLNEPPESQGIELGAGWELPLGIVYRVGAHQYQRRASGNRLADLGTIARHSIIPISDDIAFADHRYLVSDGDTMVRKSSARILRHRDRPNGVSADDKWIHVDLSEQTVVAYEGDRAVYGTLASTGTEEHETPSGLFRIESKHVSTTMDDLSAGEQAYSIEDVPWTMYFEGNYALHGAFWHYTFGRVRSHGCVNLSPSDARWLFQWATPELPVAWHGVFASRQNPGTFVFVEK